MEIDDRIALMKSLFAKREELDRQINALFTGSAATKKQLRCSHCGQEGHNAKTCPDKAKSEVMASPEN